MGRLARDFLPDDGERASSARTLAPVPDAGPAVAGMLAGLECVGHGAAILDRDGRLVGANPRAHDLFECFATFRDGRPQCRAPAHARRFDRAIRQAHEGSRAVVALAVPQADTVVVRAFPLSSGVCGFVRASVLLVVARGGGEPMPSIGRLREAFGLTATEAEIALALAGGASASAIARGRAISLETVRSHLKTTYAKTGTGRQAGLVASVMHLRDAAPPG